LKANQRGFTVIELWVAIVIVGILATFAVSYLLNISEEARIATLQSDLSAAYKASLGYYAENPGDEITLDILKEYGYEPSEKVVLRVADGFRDSLKMTAAHESVHGEYVVDKNGRIYKSDVTNREGGV
jgi:prepilin-type N-terminal cleavage/methylation domain-containing protein